MKKAKYKIGDIYITKQGYNIELIEHTSYNDNLIRFENGHIVKSAMKEVLNGGIKNPFCPSVCNIGYFGVGGYKSKNNDKKTIEYQTWRDVIKRCYNEKQLIRYPTYKNVTMCEDWLNFQNFARWFTENFPIIEGVKFRIDKDLLQQDIKNKIYSPSTCIFLPESINSFLTNNQPKHNTSGYIGVSLNKSYKNVTWKAQINDFETGKYICIKCNCDTIEEAVELYKIERYKNAEKVKEYLRSLNYLPEEIIQLIK